MELAIIQRAAGIYHYHRVVTRCEISTACSLCSSLKSVEKWVEVLPGQLCHSEMAGLTSRLLWMMTKLASQGHPSFLKAFQSHSLQMLGMKIKRISPYNCNVILI